MPWWNESPTVMPEEVRERVAQRLGEQVRMSEIKRELRELGLHDEADGRPNANGDRVYRAIVRLRDELQADGMHLPSGHTLPDARTVLQGLIGRELRTVTGAANSVIEVAETTVLVATKRSPNGQPVPIAWVQDGLDLLAQDGDVEVHPDALEHRSAFVGAVLLSLPGTYATLTSPPRVVLAEQDSPAGAGAAAWHLNPGDTIVRTELHDLYGGSRQGGTIPSRTSPNIFLFLDKKVGGAHGYYDGWAGDHFYYTGHGQTGDQELRRGNGAVLAHAETGKALRVFRGVRGEVTYLGEFRLDEQKPWFRMEAPEIGTDATRQVVVFRLVPIGDVLRAWRDDVEFPEGAAPADVDAVVAGVAAGPTFTEVPVEQQHVEEVEVSHTTTSYTAARREQTLVLEYMDWLTASGREVVRFRVRPSGEARELVCDVWEKTRNNLIEAKGTGSRGEVRMAVGQLFDYRRFVDPSPACAVLLPDRPRPDVEELLTSVGIFAVWKDGALFVDNAGGRFM